MNVRRPLHIIKTLVYQLRRCTRKTTDRTITRVFGRLREVGKLGQMGNVFGGRHEIEMIFEKMGAMLANFIQMHVARCSQWDVMSEDDSLRLDSQMAMLGQDIELVHPISVE